jgi:hypothetical protein
MITNNSGRKIKYNTVKYKIKNTYNGVTKVVEFDEIKQLFGLEKDITTEKDIKSIINTLENKCFEVLAVL